MNLGKHLSNWLMMLLKKLLTAEVVEMVVFVYQLLRRAMEEDLLNYHISGEFMRTYWWVQ